MQHCNHMPLLGLKQAVPGLSQLQGSAHKVHCTRDLLRTTDTLSYTRVHSHSLPGWPRVPPRNNETTEPSTGQPAYYILWVCSSAPIHVTAVSSTVLALTTKRSCCRCLCSHCLLDWALAVLDAGDGCRDSTAQHSTAGAAAVQSEAVFRVLPQPGNL